MTCRRAVRKVENGARRMQDLLKILSCGSSCIFHRPIPVQPPAAAKGKK